MLEFALKIDDINDFTLIDNGVLHTNSVNNFDFYLNKLLEDVINTINFNNQFSRIYFGAEFCECLLPSEGEVK